MIYRGSSDFRAGPFAPEASPLGALLEYSGMANEAVSSRAYLDYLATLGLRLPLQALLNKSLLSGGCR